LATPVRRIAISRFIFATAFSPSPLPSSRDISQGHAAWHFQFSLRPG
jgi:hypothetical protein